MYLPISVFPVPGGPKRRIPLGGPLKPLKISLRERGVGGEREKEGGRINSEYGCSYLRSEHWPHYNLFDSFLSKFKSSNIVPNHWRTMIHNLEEENGWREMGIK